MSYHDGARLPDWMVDRNHREAAERFEHNSTIECVRSLYERFKADVAVQTKGATGDWSGFTVGLDDLEAELPAMEG